MMLNHVKTSRAGEYGYIEDRARGTCDVWHDSKRYVYRRPRSIKAFKRAILAAFGCHGTATIEGRYPDYIVRTEA